MNSILRKKKHRLTNVIISIAALFLVSACNSTPGTSRGDRPNILFAIADDQSYPYASAYGTKGIKTQAFDRVAREGALFNNAFVAAPQCSPSRAAILTGKNIWQLEEAGTHSSYFPRKFQVFTNLLETAGYEIGFTGKPWAPGNWKDAGWQRNPAGNEYNDYKSKSVPAEGIQLTDYFKNFSAFFHQKGQDAPFFFWYGCREPHRGYEEGSGINAGKKPGEAYVPSFLPDHEVIKSDIADYTFEIEWFDRHLGQMISFLEEQGELENTIIVVTADNGMPFPSAKANLYEFGTHVPLAICWPARMKGNRVIDDLVAMIDLAPTFLEIAGIRDIPDMTGKSMCGLLFTDSMNTDYLHREYVLTGRERHTHARPDNLGYPSRAIRTRDFLYVRNFKPERWPVGNPVPESAKKHSPSTKYKALWPGYHDIDDSPSKQFLMEKKEEYRVEFGQTFGKRPSEQLYNIKNDPACINNIAGDTAYAEIKDSLSMLLEEELLKQGDPRMMGHGDIFDSYPRHSSMREFPGFKKQGEYNPAYIQEGQLLIK